MKYIIYIITFLFASPLLIYSHTPQQVDHKFYISSKDNRLILKLEIPFGSILAFTERRLMDANKDGMISEQERYSFLDKKVKTYLANITIKLNDSKLSLSEHLYSKNLLMQTRKIMPEEMAIEMVFILDEPIKTQKQYQLEIIDEADVGITGYINFYSDSNDFAVSDLSKKILNGEERIFKVLFTYNIQPERKVSEATKTLGKNKEVRVEKKSSLFEKLKLIMEGEKIAWQYLFVALILAFLLGMFHALEPGHGKTIMAAYIVGSNGTIIDVLVLGLSVAFAHISVIVILTVVTLYLSQYILPTTLYPYLTLFSGIIVIIMALVLMKRAIKGKHHHSHDADFNAKLNLFQTIQLGFAGGLVPCPAAIVIFLIAIQMKKLILGLVLILFLSLGVAVTLIIIGFLIVYSKKMLNKLHSFEHSEIPHYLPIFSSIFILILGAMIIFRALTELKIW